MLNDSKVLYSKVLTALIKFYIESIFRFIDELKSYFRHQLSI